MQFVACTVCRKNRNTGETVFYETDKSAGAVVTDFTAIYGAGHFGNFDDVQQRGGERHQVVPYGIPTQLQWVVDTVNSTYEYGGRRIVQSEGNTDTEMW